MIGFAERGHLATRIKAALEAQRPLAFLFGSALSATGGTPSIRGIPTAADMIERVLHRLRTDNPTVALDSIESALLPSRYQAAMQLFLNSYGQDTLNSLIRSAVVEAWHAPDHRSPEAMDKAVDGWNLPPAVAAAGQLFAKVKQLSDRPVLTSNFDPLLEVSIRKAGGTAIGIFLTSDGRFDNIIATDAARIVHLHGYWIGSDTLHTPAQLQRGRPQLNSCLREFLRDTTLVVMGYGGWSDVFTKTLFDLLNEQSTAFDVAWSFHATDPNVIIASQKELVEAAAHAGGTRFVLYSGIDCHEFLPSLLQEVQLTLPLRTRDASSIPPRRITGDEAGVRDYPPVTTAWVGRSHEIETLSRADLIVGAITGIGGQGKSTLAAQYLQQIIADGTDFWDWRDCKESAHTFSTQLFQIVERLCAVSGTSVEMRGETDEYLIEVFFEVLGQLRGLFIFDNADQYIDIEGGHFIGAPRVLITRALRGRHRSKFIFTCRPRIEHVADGFISIELGGLTASEAVRLFALRGVPGAEGNTNTNQKIQQLQMLTGGHPLWLNLIATQVATNSAKFDVLLDRLESGDDTTLPKRMLKEVWATLAPKPRTVLRYMAEMVHPETESRIADFISGDLNYNQFRKSVRLLRSLDLIVVKASTQEDTIELHPLVREFVRHEFPPPERRRYINPIVRVLDKLITQINLSFGKEQSFDQTRYARSKVELCINAGRHEEAATLVEDLRDSLLARGYSEEFIRLAVPVLNAFGTAEIAGENIARFDKLVAGVIDCLSELGRFEEADDYLGRFEATIPGKTARYINLCDRRCYSYWCRRDYEAAMEWGRRGVELKTSAGLDTQYDCLHNLALATRDGGKVGEALEVFLRGISLADVVSGDVPPEQSNGPFWGNIGRCLLLQKHYDDALTCLRRSGRLLEDSSDPHLVNRGWAAQWLGEAFEGRAEFVQAFWCYSTAMLRWTDSSPPRRKIAEFSAARMRSERGVRAISAADAERKYLEWLRSDTV